MAHGRLPNELHRLAQALPAYEKVTSGKIAGDRFGRVGQEREYDRAEHLIFLEQLVGVEALRMSESTKLHCFGDHGRLCIDVALRALEISGDSFDEERDVAA